MSNAEEPGKAVDVTLRAASPDDDDFLFALYASTREDEMAAWGLDAAQQEMLLRMQFTAQRQHYAMAYEQANHQIILCEDQPAGRILVFRGANEIILVDIALLPDRRGAGVGAALITNLLDEAQQANRPVHLHVAKDNRARRLYERLGFVNIEDAGMHFKMEWRPNSE